MIKAENTVLLLLAAGRSQRFGDADKLEQDYLGHPLAFHVVTALEGVPFRKRVAIVSGTRLDFAARGYEMIENKTPINGLSGSIKLGVEACRACDADAVLIALADMPRVTATPIYRLLASAGGAATILASSDAVIPPPRSDKHTSEPQQQIA